MDLLFVPCAHRRSRGVEQAETLPLRGTVHERVMRTQHADVSPVDDGDPAAAAAGQFVTGQLMDATGGDLRDDATMVCLDWYGGPRRGRRTEQGADPDPASGPVLPVRPG